MERVAIILRKLTIVVALILVPGVAAGGVADTALPELLPGAKTRHLFSVPGVTDITCFGTYFSCTSLDTSTMQVGVELFGGPGGILPANDAVATSLSVAPGATVVFGTSTPADPGIGLQSNIGGAAIGSASARVLATSKKLMCTVFITDRCNFPVTFMNHLTIIAKKKQKAAN